MSEAPVRWHRRFANFERAFLLLQEVQARGITSLSQLEREGAVQRFELAYELAWKTLKDYLEEDGVVIQPVTPREVLKAAFAAGLIDDGQVWIDMMLLRNRLSHTYDSALLAEALTAFQDRYFGAFAQLHGLLATARAA